MLIVLPVNLLTTGPDLLIWFEVPGLCPSCCSDAYSVVPGRLHYADRITRLSHFVFHGFRRKGGCSYCRQRNFAVLVMIPLLSDDLELNPGPPGEGRCGSFASCLADVTANPSDSCLGDVCRSGCMLFVHPNVRSLHQCVDELGDWVHSVPVNSKVLISCSETWLKDEIYDGMVAIEGLKLFRMDRRGNGGGVSVYCSELTVGEGWILKVMGLKLSGLRPRPAERSHSWSAPSIVLQTVANNSLRCSLT